MTAPRRPAIRWQVVRYAGTVLYHHLSRGANLFGAVSSPDGETWRAFGYGRTPGPSMNVELGTFPTVTAAKGAVRDWATRRETGTPPCATCGGVTVWAEGAWTCTRRRTCGDEWMPSHSPIYSAPYEQPAD